MDNTKKIKRSVRIFPFYDALSGTLVFYGAIEVLFLTMVKKFSAEDITMIRLIASICDLILEYPSYLLIRKLGNSRAAVMGAALPLLSILLISFGQGFAAVAVGYILLSAAGNYQTMSTASVRNNLVLLDDKEGQAKLFSRASIYFSILTMISALTAPALFAYNRFFPSIICCLIYGAAVVCSFFMRDYSEQKGHVLPPEKKKDKVKIGIAMKYIIVVFCIFVCVGTLFSENTAIMMSSRLGDLLPEEKAILVYGAILWVSKLVRVGVDALLPKILDFLNSRIIIIASAAMAVAFAIVGLSGIFLKGTTISVILMAISFIIVKGMLWSPMRTFLKMKAVDTNSKKRQQFMLVMINMGQSITSIVIHLIAISTLSIWSLEYVFIVFAFVSGIEAFLAFKLIKELKKNKDILNIETVLTESGIDEVSEKISQILIDTGIERKQAISYRFLIEERLLECINNGKKNEKIAIVLTWKQSEISVKLTVEGKDIDVFSFPQNKDPFTTYIYNKLLTNADML